MAYDGAKCCNNYCHNAVQHLILTPSSASLGVIHVDEGDKFLCVNSRSVQHDHPTLHVPVYRYTICNVILKNTGLQIWGAA